MLRKLFLFTPLLLVASAIAAEEAPAKAAIAKVAAASEPTANSDGAKSKGAKADAEAKSLLGISILGNQEAPKALVIVPWKSSQLGDSVGIAKSIDDARQPVDKDVFLRELAYYEIKSGSK